MKVIGQTWQFENKPVIISTGTIVGPEEGEGPLAEDFDYVYDNIEINEKTWEKAERRLLEEAREKRWRRRASARINCNFSSAAI
ncbi:stage V sporulation protein AD [Paenibacillus sp. JCM 10914]|nr:stage V sporulation protein AD [Paenibacillus sp. JCM 10914]